MTAWYSTKVGNLRAEDARHREHAATKIRPMKDDMPRCLDFKLLAINSPCRRTAGLS
jgi:hypothetical protein